MDFLQFISDRHSTRRFDSRDIEKEKLDQILRSAIAAPTAGNLQPWKIVVVNQADKRQALVHAALGQAFLAQAPLVLVFLKDPEQSARVYGARGRELYAEQDTAIACTYAQLAAHSLGLSSCWVGAFRPTEVSTIVEAPASLIPVALLAIGYAAENPLATTRRPLTEVVSWETYQLKKSTG